MPKHAYDLIRESDLWPAEAVLDAQILRVQAALGDAIDGSITYVFDDDAAVHVLNREWRGFDKPTNVLSFPDGDMGDDGIVHLGDVILAHETLVREAADLGISFDDHLTHLLLHGTLHILGYDHIDDTDAQVMESLEIRILEGLGIKNPYQDGAKPLD